MNRNNQSHRALIVSLLIFSMGKIAALSVPPMSRELLLDVINLEHVARQASTNPAKQHFITDKPATEADVRNAAQPVCNAINGFWYKIVGYPDLDRILNHIEKEYGFNVLEICKKQPALK